MQFDTDKENHKNMYVVFKYFSKGKNFLILICFMLCFLLNFFGDYFFLLLSEKSKYFTISQMYYSNLVAGIFGNLIFTFGLHKLPRRWLSFSIVGTILFISFCMMCLSFFLRQYTLDVLGLICTCKYFSHFNMLLFNH